MPEIKKNIVFPNEPPEAKKFDLQNPSKWELRISIIAIDLNIDCSEKALLIDI